MKRTSVRQQWARHSVSDTCVCVPHERALIKPPCQHILQYLSIKADLRACRFTGPRSRTPGPGGSVWRSYGYKLVLHNTQIYSLILQSSSGQTIWAAGDTGTPARRDPKLNQSQNHIWSWKHTTWHRKPKATKGRFQNGHGRKKALGLCSTTGEALEHNVLRMTRLVHVSSIVLVCLCCFCSSISPCADAVACWKSGCLRWRHISEPLGGQEVPVLIWVFCQVAEDQSRSRVKWVRL